MKNITKFLSIILVSGIFGFSCNIAGAQQLSFRKNIPNLKVESKSSGSARWETSSIDFGTVTVGQYATRSAVLVNEGGSAADYSNIVSTSELLTIDSSSCKNVLPLGSCVVHFTFSPTQTGSFSITGIVPYQASHTNSLSLQGVGGPELLTLSTDELMFNSVEVGSAPVSLSVSVLNSTTRNVSGIPPSFTGNFTTQHNCPFSLAPGATCQITVTFNPQIVGVESGVLSINSSLGLQSVALSAKAVETKATLNIKTNSSSDFGSIKVGQSATRQFTFSNTGSATLTGISPTVELSSGANVVIKSTNCSTSLAVGSSCDITLEYAPSAGGTMAGVLKVSSSAKLSPNTVSVTGSAVAVDPQAAQVEFLLRGEGVDGSTVIIDDTGRTTWSVSGTATTRPRISTAAARSGTSSIYFPGGGSLKSNMNTSLGTADFTLEFWSYRTAFQNNTQSIIENGGWIVGGNNPGYYTAGFKFSPRAWCTAVNGNCYAYDCMMQAGPAYSLLNVWQHVAITRQGNTYRMYVNGSKVFESVQTTNFNMDNGATDLRVLIGSEFTGYLDDIRLTKGLARYTGQSFTIEQPLSDVTPTVNPDPNVASVETLSNFEGVNGATTFTDSTGKYTWTTQGSGSNAEVPVISSNFARFGATSLYLPGNGKYIKTNQNLSLGSGNFTIEFWAMKIEDNGTRPNAVLETNGWIIGNNNPGFYSSAGWRFSPYHWCTIADQSCGSYGRMMQAGAAYNLLNIWRHIAVTRDGNTWRFYVDGLKVSESVQTFNIDMDNSQADLKLLLGRNFKGYIDDLRITKGVARYTGASFTPNTSVTLN